MRSLTTIPVVLFCGLISLTLTPPAAGSQAGAAPSALKPLDVIYVPTPPEVVSRMLTLAKVGAQDVVYDLGSGDGRIVIAAVKDFGARKAVGYELDPVRNKEAAENAQAAGVTDRVRFVAQDLFEADLSEATVVTMYLLPTINERLVPKLRGLKPGTRIITHNYDLTADWAPDQKVIVNNHIIYVFTVKRR